MVVAACGSVDGSPLRDKNVVASDKSAPDVLAGQKGQSAHLGDRFSRTVCVQGALLHRVEGDVIEIADIFTSQGGQLVRADGFPPHVDRFERAGYNIAALLAQD